MTLPIPTEPSAVFTAGPWRANRSCVVSDAPNGRPGDEKDRHYYGGILIAESIFRPGDVRLLAEAPAMFDIVQQVAKLLSPSDGDIAERAHALIGRVLQGEPPPEFERDEVKALLRALALSTAAEREQGHDLTFAQIERDSLRERLGEVLAIVRDHPSVITADAAEVLRRARRDLADCGQPHPARSLVEAAPAMRDALHQILHANKTGDVQEFANGLASAEAALAKAKRPGGTRG